MAALLRHGARRVGGSVVERTRAASTTPAVGEEQRLLTTEHVRPGPPKDPRARLHEIQNRKEELYDLISLMEMTSMPKTYHNRELLKFLSGQVKPRPQDSKWRRTWHSKQNDVLVDTGYLVSTCLLGYLYWSRLTGRRPDQVKARAMKAASCLTEKQRR